MSGYISKNEIAFDFDCVIADTMGLFVEMVRNEYGRTDISLDDITDYDLRNCLDVSLEILVDIGSKIMSPNCADYLRPMKGAIEVLNGFKDEKLLIITARPEKEPVEAWIETYLDIERDSFEVIATGDYNAKAEELKKHEKKYLVEDRIETCFYLKEQGFEPIVFVQPWNRVENDFPEVNSWEELSKLMEK